MEIKKELNRFCNFYNNLKKGNLKLEGGHINGRRKRKRRKGSEDERMREKWTKECQRGLNNEEKGEE